MRYVFREFKEQATRIGTCPVCGKDVRRQKTFVQTASPFNAHPDGRPKTEQEVYEAVRAQADAWQPKDFTHKTCKPVTA